MNKETYEALCRVLLTANGLAGKLDESAFEGVGGSCGFITDVRQVEAWIDEVAKEYCPDCGEINHRCKP